MEKRGAEKAWPAVLGEQRKDYLGTRQGSSSKHKARRWIRIKYDATRYIQM